ncbi:MAG: diguanylate cyclase [Wenzhouxiangellaceae bacterium]|nr:diguanylate cyclase [Wenzhouxiangellaceae bacterium]MBS3823088.1 diguanylate cyclase [Wenzhouxiangellaceae bacterium]
MTSLRLLMMLTTTLLTAAWPLQSPGQDFSIRLERLEQLASSDSQAAILQRIENLQASLDEATPREHARFTLLKARAAAREMRMESAIALLKKLLDRRNELDRDLELSALNLATNVLVVNDRFETGFDYFRQALELADVVDAPEMRAQTFIVAAGFHSRIGEHGIALEYANQAMQEVERGSAPRVHCAALELRARAEQALNRPDEAIADFRKAIGVCESASDKVFSSAARIGLAQILRVRGKPAEAELSLREALDQLSSRGISELELEARYRLADLLLDRDGRVEARSLLAPTMEWIDSPGGRAIRAEALRVHARLASLESDREAVYRHTRRAVELDRRHAQRIRQMRFTLLMSAHDDSARARELELLRSRNALAELDREGRRQEELALTYGGFGAAIAGLLLITLLIKAAHDRAQFQKLSQHDGLTGLLNHTRFFELAQQSFQRARQNAIPFSLIVADIDLFKQVNDEYGHLVGDSVLARVGARLRSAFGSDAIIGRLGGEEFGVALLDCDIDSAVARIEHLRATLNRQRADDEEPAVTMSFGVAELAREPTLDVLYAHADQALYDAKDAGRNRVVTVARIDLSGAGMLT